MEELGPYEWQSVDLYTKQCSSEKNERGRESANTQDHVGSITRSLESRMQGAAYTHACIPSLIEEPDGRAGGRAG